MHSKVDESERILADGNAKSQLSDPKWQEFKRLLEDDEPQIDIRKSNPVKRRLDRLLKNERDEKQKMEEVTIQYHPAKQVLPQKLAKNSVLDHLIEHPAISIVTVAFTLVVIWTIPWRRMRQKINHTGGSASTVKHSTIPNNSSQSTAVAENHDTIKVKIEESNVPRRPSNAGANKEDIPVKYNDLKPPETKDTLVSAAVEIKSSTATMLQSDEKPPLESMKTNEMVEASGTSTMLRNQKVQAVNKLAEEIRLIETVLKEQGLDVALAPQVALSLQSTQHVLQSHEERLKVESYHKLLERQLSQQQHAESLAATRYDPNWKEKVLLQRERCIAAISRLAWESLLLQVLLPLAGPIHGIISSSISSSSTGRFATALQVLSFLFSMVCDCIEDSPGLETVPSGGVVSLLLPVESRISDWIWEALGWDTWLAVENGVCYGQCLLVFGLAVVITWLGHSLLRAFAAPPGLHHGLNASMWFLWYCPKSAFEALQTTDMDSIMGTSLDREPWPTLCWVAALGVLYILVHWTCWKSCRAIKGASSLQFARTMEWHMGQLETLEFQMGVVRVLNLAIRCGMQGRTTNMQSN